MSLRTIAFTVLGLAALAVVAAPPASAAPVTAPVPLPQAVSFGGVHVDVGVGFPIGRRVERHVYPSGYWTQRYEQVWVEGRVIGYDAYGYPIVSAGYYETRVVPVWVPTVRRVTYVSRPHGYLGVGFRFR
jgi:hypothetical protein